ncbi:MAG: YfcE family phosphodiesterase [Pirellulales bacterium]
MRIGIISDTHGHVAMTQQAVTLLKSLDVERLLHCGDIGTAQIVDMLAAWPTDFVLGNVDDEAELRPAMVHPGHHLHGRFASLEIEGKRIAVLHGDYSKKLRETAESGEWDLVCFGHTHEAERKQIGNTLLCNPGAVYRASPRSIATIELPSMELHVFML